MCLCMYVKIKVCVHVCISACVYTHVCLCGWMYAFMYVSDPNENWLYQLFTKRERERHTHTHTRERRKLTSLAVSGASCTLSLVLPLTSHTVSLPHPWAFLSSAQITALNSVYVWMCVCVVLCCAAVHWYVWVCVTVCAITHSWMCAYTSMHWYTYMCYFLYACIILIV